MGCEMLEVVMDYALGGRYEKKASWTSTWQTKGLLERNIEGISAKIPLGPVGV